MGTLLNEQASTVAKHCLPDGQLKKFPTNWMQMMTTSGAKGG